MSYESSDGVSVADVVEAVDGVDPERIEALLDPVTDDGVVTRGAIDTTVSDTSKRLATAETRIELAGNAYEDAAAVADPVADIPAVGTRLDAFKERLADVESRIPELRPDLSTPDDIHRRPTAVYEFAVLIQETVTATGDAVEAAEDLSTDVERFQSWLEQPDRRYDAFAEDLSLVEESIDELEATIDGIPDDDDPAARWAAATMRVRVLLLLVADLRAEHRDLRLLADRSDDPFRTELGERLDGVEERVAEVESAIDDVADPAWEERFAADLAALDEKLAAFEPPVDWGAVERALEAHRPNGPTGDQ
jgi:hypothetical protein